MAGGPIAGVIFSNGNGNWSPVIIYSAMAMFWGSMLIFATRLQGMYIRLGGRGDY